MMSPSDSAKKTTERRRIPNDLWCHCWLFELFVSDFWMFVFRSQLLWLWKLIVCCSRESMIIGELHDKNLKEMLSFDIIMIVCSTLLACASDLRCCDWSDWLTDKSLNLAATIMLLRKRGSSIGTNHLVFAPRTLSLEIFCEIYSSNSHSCDFHTSLHMFTDVKTCLFTTLQAFFVGLFRIVVSNADLISCKNHEPSDPEQSERHSAYWRRRHEVEKEFVITRQIV